MHQVLRLPQQKENAELNLGFGFTLSSSTSLCLAELVRGKRKEACFCLEERGIWDRMGGIR